MFFLFQAVHTPLGLFMSMYRHTGRGSAATADPE
jgi:hypothetical protein